MTAIETTIKESKELTKALENETKDYCKGLDRMFKTQLILEGTMLVMIGAFVCFIMITL